MSSKARELAEQLGVWDAELGTDWHGEVEIIAATLAETEARGEARGREAERERVDSTLRFIRERDMGSAAIVEQTINDIEYALADGAGEEPHAD
jgi:hypothetical protein